MSDAIRSPNYTITTTRYLAIIITFTVLIPTLAQRLDFEVGPHSRNRRFSWSTEAPLTRAINELAPEVIPHMNLLNQHITRVETAVLNSLQRQRVIPDAVVQPCNPSIKWFYTGSVFRFFGNIGFLEPAWECGSDVSGVKFGTDEPGYTLDQLYNAISSRGVGLKLRANEIVRRAINNFTRPDVRVNYAYSTVSAKCMLSPVCMYRQGPEWRQAIDIYSHGRDDYVPDGNLNLMFEIAGVDKGILGNNLLFRLPKYDNGSAERVYVDNTTTMIHIGRGQPNPSCFRSIPLEDNPALLEALDMVDHSAQQAEDAVTNSNLAILFLPLGLNLIPIALFADVSSRMMLFYTLMSDVLTVIPLGIKGVELIIIGKSRYRSIITRVLSPGLMNLTKPLAAGGEIWGAECRVRDEVGRTGFILTIISVVFLLVGIGGEFVARWFAGRRKSKKWALVDEESSEECASGLCESASISTLGVGACAVKPRYSSDDDEDDSHCRFAW